MKLRHRVAEIGNFLNKRQVLVLQIWVMHPEGPPNCDSQPSYNGSSGWRDALPEDILTTEKGA